MDRKTLLISIIATLFCNLSFSQRIYTVKAINGLIIRQGPSTKTERVGKLPYDYKFKVEESNIADEFSLTENKIKIKGNWIRVESEFGNGYVFEGFTSRDYDIKGYGYGIYGKVKSYKNHTFYNGGMQNADWREFNENGEITKDYYYNSRDKIWEISTHKIYNEKGQLIQNNGSYDSYSYKFDDNGNEIEEYQVKKDGTPYLKTIRTFDKKGNITSADYDYFKDKSNFKWVNKYNSKNKPLDSKRYNYNGELDRYYIYKYKNDTILMSVHKINPDETKRITSKRTFEETSEYTIEKFVEYFKEDKKEGKIYTSRIKVYDKNNNLVKEEFFDCAESQLPNFSFSGGGGNYNERVVKNYINNKLVSKKLFRTMYYQNREQELLIEDYTYGKNYRKAIYYTHYTDVVTKHTRVSYYNYNSQIVKYIEYDDSNNNKDVYEYQYTYDHYGNWTLKKTFRNGKFYRDYIQEFEYYE